MDDGRVVTLVQNRDGQEQPIENGQRVLVQYGADYSRVVPAPPAAGGGSPGGWQNPDDLTDDEAPFYNQDSFGDQQSS